MNKIYHFSTLVFIILSLSSFDNSNKNLNENKSISIISEFNNNTNFDKSLSQLLDHFRANGFDGKKSPKAYQLIGAQDGCAYSGDNFRIQIYKFDDISKMPAFLKFRNGHFGLFINKGDENQIKKIFYNF